MSFQNSVTFLGHVLRFFPNTLSSAYKSFPQHMVRPVAAILYNPVPVSALVKVTIAMKIHHEQNQFVMKRLIWLRVVHLILSLKVRTLSRNVIRGHGGVRLNGCILWLAQSTFLLNQGPPSQGWPHP